MGRSAEKTNSYIWNPKAETMPRAELTALQTQRLQQQVTRAFERVPFYRRALEGRGVHPRDVRTLEDIERLPITVKDDFRTLCSDIERCDSVTCFERHYWETCGWWLYTSRYDNVGRRDGPYLRSWRSNG